MPLTCHHSDHFSAHHISLTCTAAPVFDPDGQLLAVLDISAYRSPGCCATARRPARQATSPCVRHRLPIPSARFLMGVWLGGYLYDVTGNYDVVWKIAILLSVAAAALHWFIKEAPIRRLESAEARA